MPKANRAEGSRSNAESGKSTKKRRRGYRGYGSPLRRDAEQFGGTVHWGRGFTGVGFPGESGAMLPREPEILPDDRHPGGRK